MQVQREFGRVRILVALEPRLFGRMAFLRNACFDPAIGYLVPAVVVFGVSPRNLLRERFGIEPFYDLRDGRALGVEDGRPRAGSLIVALKREGALHFLQLVLERGDEQVFSCVTSFVPDRWFSTVPPL